MIKPKTFAIYCSEGASRVIKFYAVNENLERYKPLKVIYDGSRKEVLDKLTELFQGDLVVFDKSSELYNPKRIHNSTSEFIQKTLLEYSVDYLLCFGDKILKKGLISLYQKRLINFHPSLLPSFKGLLGINQSLDYGVSVLGNTAHYIDEGVDTGEIILQTAMLSEEFEDYEDVLEMQLPMIKMILRDIVGYNISDDVLFKELSNRNKKILIPRKCRIRSPQS